MSGHQFSGVTQLLPLGISADQAALALQSLQQALGGKVPTKAHEPLKLARDQFAWREFRTSTKFLLCALANSLKQMLGDSWSLAGCRPGNLLAPKSTTGERYKFLEEEFAERADMTGFDCSSFVTIRVGTGSVTFTSLKTFTGWSFQLMRALRLIGFCQTNE